MAFPALSRLLDRKQAPWVLLALGVLGLGARLLLAASSIGSNDSRIWFNFSQLIAVSGVEWMYRSVPGFNHPPLMGWWSLAALKLAMAHGWRFDASFKLLPIAAEACSAMLLFSIWRKRDQRFATGALAFAAFAWNIDSLLVSGYHGNTDSLAAMFALLACWLIEEHAAPFAAGLALAAAINVKLIPVLLIPVLAVRMKSPRDLVRLAIGLSIGTVPYFPMFLTSWEGFQRNAISYNSNFDNWGLPFVVNQGETSTALHDVFAAIHSAFAFVGRYLIIGGVFAACAFARWKKTGDGYQLAAIAFGLFLVLTPGFGVQYTVYVVPVLFAASLRWGMAYAAAAGTFIFSVYFHFWNRAMPLESVFIPPIPLPSALLGVLPWAMLIAFLVVEVRRMRAQAAHD